MSSETPALDVDRSSAEGAGEGHRLGGLPPSGLGWAFPLGREMWQGQRLGQALGQVWGWAFQSSPWLFLVPGYKWKKFKLPPAAAALHTRLFLLPKDWAVVQLREGNREERRRVEGSENYFTSIKKKVRSLILLSQQVDIWSRNVAAANSGDSDVPAVGGEISNGAWVPERCGEPCSPLPEEFLPQRGLRSFFAVSWEVALDTVDTGTTAQWRDWGQCDSSQGQSLSSGWTEVTPPPRQESACVGAVCRWPQYLISLNFSFLWTFNTSDPW